MQWRCLCRGFCCLLALLFTAHAHRPRTLPSVPATTTDPLQRVQLSRSGAEKAAYGALADVLENADAAELIDQLRKAAATPPPDEYPTLTPPEIKDETTVLENVPLKSVVNMANSFRRASPSYGATSPALPAPNHLIHNRSSAPHFPAAWWSGLCILVAGTLWLPRCIIKMGHWDDIKTATAATGYSCRPRLPAHFIFDLLLLA